MDQPHDLAASIRRRRVAGPGAWRISPTSTLSANATAFASKAAAPGRAATIGWSECSRGSKRSMPSDPLDVILITGDMTDAGRSAEWAEFLAALAAHPGLAERTLVLPGQPRRQRRRPRQPGAARPADSPGSGCARCARCRPSPRVQGDRVRVVERRRDSSATRWPPPCAPSMTAIAAFADSGGCALARSSGSGRTSFRWCCRPTPETASASSCSTPTPRRISPSPTRSAWSPPSRRGAPRRRPAVSRGPLDRRAAPPPRRVSEARQGVLGADRHGADQRQLVRAPAAAARPTDRRHARPPPHRLDRRLRRAAHRLGALAGHGRDGRPADLFPHPPICGAAPDGGLDACSRRRRVEIAGDPQARPAASTGEPVASSGAPSRSESQRLDGCCAQKVSSAIVIGTPMKAPKKPHRKVQKNTANSTSERRDRERAAGDPRLDIAADHELDDD